MLSGWFSAFILIWILCLVFLFSVGGYFMFRKFLKRLPKEDGKSILDRQEETILKTRHLWTPEYRELLEELVSPVPELFRDRSKNRGCGAFQKYKKNDTGQYHSGLYSRYAETRP